MAHSMSTSTFNGNVCTIARTAPKGNLTGIVSRLATLLSVWEERRALAHLDQRTLRDLGLSSVDVERETSRSFLDVPCNRV
jgi:uncharacterized protein YjiS (DUF1127 family)